jgi:hypothetical protein
LFLLTQLSQFLFMAPIFRRVVRTRVAAGDHDRDDLTASLCPFGKRATNRKFLIIRVGMDAHRTLRDVFVVVHNAFS